MDSGDVNFTLPSSLHDWRAARKRLGCDDMDIHNLITPNSASEITVQQYLTLKVLWRKQKQAEMEKYLGSIGFEQGIFDKMKDSMNGRKAWRLYIEAIGANVGLPPARKPYTRHTILSDDLGGFQLVLHNQLEVTELPVKTTENDVNKVEVTPMLDRLRPRPRRLFEPSVPQTPQRGSVFDAIEDISTSKHPEPKLPDAKDEQIVNSALVSFLQAVWIDDERNSNWTLKRKEFRFNCKDSGAGFAARTDGHLEMSSHLRGQSAGILEVKARFRPRADPGNHKIEMQESTQMALWIAQEPQSHWMSPVSRTAKDDTSLQHEYSRTFQ